MKKTLAAVAAALTLAGCSSGTSGGQAGGSTNDQDACGLLADDQINQAAQLAPKAHAVIPNNPLKTCRWDLNGENNVIKIYTGDAKLFAESKGDALDGLGDKAVWDPGAEKVQAVKGGTTFELWIVLLNQRDHERTAAIKLANDVAAKLGWGGGAKIPADTGSATKTTTPSSTTKASGKASETSETQDTKDTGTSDIPPPETTEPSGN
jgi:hypothetical protein